MSEGVTAGGSVILLGATGRLGPDVAEALRRRGYHVVLAGRGRPPAVRLGRMDVTDRRWWSSSAWRSALDHAGVPLADVAAVVNLVAGRERTRAASAAVGRGSIRALIAAAGAPRGGVLSIHVGSVAELSSQRLSNYAAGKAAARAEARRCAATVVLTIGVIPRPPGAQADALLRRLCAAVPEVASLPIAASTAGEAGEAIAHLLDTGRGHLAVGATTEVRLAGQARRLGDVVGAVSRHRCWSRALLWLLARLPAGRWPTIARVGSCARMAAGRQERNHYMATASPVAPEPRWRLLPTGQGRLALVPPRPA